MPENGERNVPQDMRFIMVGVAVLLDVINIVSEPETFGLGGIIMDFISTLAFSVWLGHYGINIWSSNNIDRTLITVAVDALPIGDLTFPWARRVWKATKERKELPMQTKKKPASGGWRL